MSGPRSRVPLVRAPADAGGAGAGTGAAGRSARSRTLRGMAFMTASVIAVSGVNAIGHHLAETVHPFEVAFFRSFFSVLALAPVLRRGLAPLRTGRLGLLATRGLLDGGAALLFFLALALSPLAKVTALSFSAPLFTALLAVVVLGERAGGPRIGALLAGFAGMLIIVQPGLVPLDLGALAMLGFAAAWGAAMAVTKALTRTESSLTISLCSAIVITPCALIAALPFWTWPSWPEMGWLVTLGLLSTIRQLTLAQAFKEADATAILPVDFSRLIFAAAIGYAVFAEVPSASTWIGGAIIFAAATYLAFRERKA